MTFVYRVYLCTRRPHCKTCYTHSAHIIELCFLKLSPTPLHAATPVNELECSIRVRLPSTHSPPKVKPESRSAPEENPPGPRVVVVVEQGKRDVDVVVEAVVVAEVDGGEHGSWVGAKASSSILPKKMGAGGGRGASRSRSILWSPSSPSSPPSNLPSLP